MSEAAVGPGSALAAARARERDAFNRLTAPYLPELRAHCIRLLGNAEDGEDALQEALLRAWLRLAALRDDGSLRSWLYAIATNASLTLLQARRRRGAPVDVLDSVEAATDAGADAFEQRESAERAFATAIRALPPRQRAVLILRDGLALSASEVASLLRTSTASVNSALQRAREGIGVRDGDAPLSDLEHALHAAYVAAWDGSDVDRLVTLARSDAVRTALLERLGARGGGWVRLPATGDWDQAVFRPAFSHTCRARG